MQHRPDRTIYELLEQLSFLEAMDASKQPVDQAAVDKAIAASLEAYTMALEMDVITGAPLEIPESLSGLTRHVLASVANIQNLIFACAPYLALAEEELTGEDGMNELFEHGINKFFMLLKEYVTLFDVRNIPKQLPDDEKARFLRFVRTFAQNAQRFEPSGSISERVDHMGAAVDSIIRDGSLDELMGGPEAREAFLQKSPRSLTPLTRSRKAYMPISKVAKKQLMAAMEPLSVDVGGGALVESQIWVSEGVQLDEFDIELQHTIGEMVQHNQNRPITATPAQIFRECAALMDKEKVGPEMEALVVQSVDKMLQTRGAIDYTQQMKKHKRIKKQDSFNYDDFESMHIEGHLIEGRKLTVNAGGHAKVAYRFYDMPMYYAYSRGIGQIAAVDKKLLNTSQAADISKTRKNTRDFVVLKRTLAREVERMKREFKLKAGQYEQRLSYQKIQEEVGLAQASEKQLRTLRADIDYLCELWTSLGHIQSFEKYKNAKAYAGVRIVL